MLDWPSYLLGLVRIYASSCSLNKYMGVDVQQNPDQTGYTDHSGSLLYIVGFPTAASVKGEWIHFQGR